MNNNRPHPRQGAGNQRIAPPPYPLPPGKEGNPREDAKTDVSTEKTPAPTDPPHTAALSDALRLSFGALRVVMIVLLALTLLRSSLFIVPQQERAFVLRFGRITGIGDARIREPGLHLAFPTPIDEIVRLPGERILTIHSDSFHHGLDAPDTDPAGRHAQRRRPYFRATLTADRNLLHSQWTLRYTVVSPDAYLFSFNAIDRLLRLELDRAIVQAMARTDVDRALRADRELRETVHGILAQRIDALALGIRIHQVDAERISPPPAVADRFDNVIKAEQEGNQLVSRARIEAARIIGEARAEAADRLATAQAFALNLAGKSAADATTLRALEAVGIDAPDTTLAQALALERLSRAFQDEDGPRIIRLRPPAPHREIRLQLSGETARPADR